MNPEKRIKKLGSRERSKSTLLNQLHGAPGAVWL